MFYAVKGAKKQRLSAAERRRQIVRVASALLAERGIDHVRMPDVAAAADVTRAVVYRFFPSRAALLAAVLEDFRDELSTRFRAREGLLRTPRAVAASIRGFGEASCDAIDAAGAGGWILLTMEGPDPELAALSRETRALLLRPWLGRVARYTGADRTTAVIVSEMAVATSRAVLSLYIAGTITREQALDALSRGIRALLAGFRARAPRRAGG